MGEVIDDDSDDDDDRADHIRRVIAARCGDVLSEDDIAQAFATPTEADLAGESVWVEAAERMMDALNEVEERLGTLERIVNGEDEDEDDAHDEQPGDRRRA